VGQVNHPPHRVVPHRRDLGAALKVRGPEFVRVRIGVGVELGHGRARTDVVSFIFSLRHILDNKTECNPYVGIHRRCIDYVFVYYVFLR
jgi:hypothetical protein